MGRLMKTLAAAALVVAVLAGCEEAVTTGGARAGSTPAVAPPAAAAEKLKDYRIEVNDTLTGAVLDGRFYWGRADRGAARAGTGEVDVTIEGGYEIRGSNFYRSSGGDSMGFVRQESVTVADLPAEPVVTLDEACSPHACPVSGRVVCTRGRPRSEVCGEPEPTAPVPPAPPAARACPDKPVTSGSGDGCGPEWRGPTITVTVAYQPASMSATVSHHDQKEVRGTATLAWSSPIPQSWGEQENGASVWFKKPSFIHSPGGGGDVGPDMVEVGDGRCGPVQVSVTGFPGTATLYTHCEKGAGTIQDLLGDEANHPADSEIETYLVGWGTVTATCWWVPVMWSCYP